MIAYILLITTAALPVLIGFMVNDKKGLFCASSDLLTTLLRESTHYCTITGTSYSLKPSSNKINIIYDQCMYLLYM